MNFQGTGKRLSSAAASYVLHGAHRRGGRVLAATMGKAGLPTSHVLYSDGPQVEALVKGLRNRTRIADDAVRVFQGLLDVMDEIDQQTTSTTTMKL